MPLEIAILEDDVTQAQLIESWLLEKNYQCQVFYTGQSFLHAVEQTKFDLLLIDWELPDINGPEVMQAIRQGMHLDTTIIFVTSRDREEDIVSVLSSGADDYLVKPIRQLEFLARVKANTRRIQGNNTAAMSNRVDFSPYVFNLNSQQVLVHDEVIELSGKEFELSYFLFCNEGKLLERKHILAEVWQHQAELNTRTVDTHMSTIRKKLALSPENGWRLKSIYGHGYRLERMTDR